MRILTIASGNFNNPEENFPIQQAFIYDQLSSLEKINVESDLYLIKGKGVFGYISNFFRIRKKVRSGNYGLIHAHYGTSGFISAIASSKPVVVTFHGSDINNENIRIISFIASKLSKHSIYVSEKLLHLSNNKSRLASVIPCGVDFEIFFPMDRSKVREKLGFDKNHIYVLFSSNFDNPVKNVSLAKRAIALLEKEIIFLELKNKTRTEVCELINAADLLLLTSFSEGSPQVIKEAMACNCPIVATDVGDVKEVVGDTISCFVTGFDATEIAKRINQVIEFGNRTNGRDKIAHFDNNLIASRIMEIYDSVFKGQKQ